MKTKINLCIIFGLMPLIGFAQSWNANPPGNNLIGVEWIGSLTGAFPLDIKTVPAQSINLWTTNTPQATLDASVNFTIGQTSTTNYFGIGVATPHSYSAEAQPV